MLRDRAATAALWILIALPFTGCASVKEAYARDAASRIEVEETFTFDDETIEADFAKKEQLRFPARLAVTGLERNPWGAFADASSFDFESTLAASTTIFSDVLPLPAFVQSGVRACTDMERLRKTAARVRADAVLLYEQRVDLNEETNAWRVLNLTVVGLWVAPSVDMEARIETRAALIDVRNGVIYTTLRDVRSGTASATSAGAGDRAQELKQDLRNESFAALRESLEGKIARMQERAEAP